MPQQIDPNSIQWDDAPPQSGGFPGIIQGLPKQPNPLEEERLRLSQESEARQAEKDARGTEAQGKAAVLLGRITGGFADINDITGALPDAERPGVSETLLYGSLGPESIIARNTTDWQRRAINDVQRDIVDALLTLGTGAAYNQEQLEAMRVSYFPQYGDTAEEANYKKRRLQRMIETARLQAGPLGEQLDEVLAPLMTSLQPQKETPAQNDQQDGQEQGLVGSVTYEGPNNYSPEAQEMATDPNLSDGSLLSSIGTVGKQGITLGLSDEAAGVGGAIASVLRGDISGVGQAYRDNRDAEKIRIEKARERLGYAALPVEVLAGGGGVANAMGRTFGIAEGIGTGALGGFGYGQGFEGSTSNALVGGIAGGGIVKGAQALGNVLNTSSARGANALADAGRAEGVTVNRAMANPNSNNAVSKVDATALGGPRIQREMKAIEGQVEGRVSDLGRGGRAMDRVGVGDTAQVAATRQIKETGKKAKVKYDRAERLAGDAKVAPRESLATVDAAIAKLSETPSSNTNEIRFLEGLKADLSKDLTVGGLRRMRTSLRQKISKGDLVFGEDEATVLSVMDAAADDIRNGLRAQGKEAAAKAFDSADKAYRARMEYINGTLQKIIGKRNANLSAEQIANKIDSLVKSDTRGLRKFYASLTPEERADVAATFAETLGTNNRGEFTVAQFLRQTSPKNMSDDAIKTIFGPEGAESVRNLRILGKQIERVTGAMNSRTSKSGVSGYRDFLWSVVAGVGGLTQGGATAAATAAGVGAATAAKQVLSARALMSPKISKWLLTAPQTSNPAAINAHFDKLAGIAKAEPALANEIETFRNAVMQAANDNLGAVAAQDSQGQ